MDGWPYTTFPTGWYQVEWSSKLASGDVKTLHFFDRELVAYRTAGASASHRCLLPPSRSPHWIWGMCQR